MSRPTNRAFSAPVISADDAVRTLETAYRRIARTGHPEWAYPDVVPPIPFVGMAYGASGQPRLLVYASAENLRGLVEQYPDWYRGDRAWNRHRGSWDKYKTLSIKPFDDGGLAGAAALLWQWQGKPLPGTYEDFVERLAVANLSKFTIFTAGRNQDPGAKEIAASHAYVAADIEALRPGIVLLANGGKHLANIARLLLQWVRTGGGVVVQTYQYSRQTFAQCQRKARACAIDEEDSLEREVMAAGALVRADLLGPGPRAYFHLLKIRYDEGVGEGPRGD